MDYVAFAEIVPLRIKLTKKHVIDELLTWFIASTEISSHYDSLSYLHLMTNRND